MINDKLKATAIARIKRKVPIEEIALDLDIPYMVLKEWRDEFTVTDLVVLESNIYAAETFASSNEIEAAVKDKLDNKLQQCAIEIANETYKAISLGDPILSKSLQICADTITKLHATFIAPNNPQDMTGVPDANSISLFSNMLRD